MDNTEFYQLLVSAKENSNDMYKIISEIMPIININSKLYNEYLLEYESYIDEDLKSTLIEYLIRLVKSDSFANKLANNSINET